MGFAELKALGEWLLKNWKLIIFLLAIGGSFLAGWNLRADKCENDKKVEAAKSLEQAVETLEAETKGSQAASARVEARNTAQRVKERRLTKDYNDATKKNVPIPGCFADPDFVRIYNEVRAGGGQP